MYLRPSPAGKKVATAASILGRQHSIAFKFVATRGFAKTGSVS